jgi:hypothetical protein
MKRTNKNEYFCSLPFFVTIQDLEDGIPSQAGILSALKKGLRGHHYDDGDKQETVVRQCLTARSSTFAGRE